MSLFTLICATVTRDQSANARPKGEGMDSVEERKGGWVDQSDGRAI